MFGNLYGMAMRVCPDLNPKYQVRHRCPCTKKEVCGAEEEKVAQLTREGKLPTNYVLPAPAGAAARQQQLRGARRVAQRRG